ncbi:MAG: hypothetical protein ABSH11_04635 [Verrucomicrobiota bacterium]
MGGAFWYMEENLVLILFLFLPVAAGGALWFFFHFHLRHRSSPGWGKLIAGNFLVLIFLLTLIPLAGELYFRFFDDSTVPVTVNHTNTKGAKRWMERHYRESVSGVRDDIAYSFNIADGKRRVSFVGDSFTAGHGIKDIRDRFANRLRRLHPEWEVHLLAIYGADTGEEIYVIENCIEKDYEFDQVVLVYNLNDISDIMPEWERVLESLDVGADKQSWLERNSYFVNILSYRWRISRNPDMAKYFDFVKTGYAGPLWEQQKKRLRQARDLVETHGAHFAVVTFPFMHALGQNNYEYQFIHDQLDAFWKELNVPHLDLLPVFRDLPPRKITVNRYDAHPNEFANALAAEKIDVFLCGLMRTNAPPARFNNR